MNNLDFLFICLDCSSTEKETRIRPIGEQKRDFLPDRFTKFHRLSIHISLFGT